MEKITFNEFVRMDIKVGEITRAENVEGSSKLLKLTVDLGDQRTIVAGLAGVYQQKELTGKKIIVLANLEPRKIMGIESHGMLLAADDDGRPILLTTDHEVKPGTKVR